MIYRIAYFPLSENVDMKATNGFFNRIMTRNIQLMPPAIGSKVKVSTL